MEKLDQIPFQGKKLDVVLLYPSTRSTWTRFGVILTHGSGGDLNSKQLQQLTKQLTEFGFVVFCFTCKPPNFEYRVKAFRTVLEYMRENVDVTGCIIGGRSMGGRVAAELASRISTSDILYQYILGVACFSYPLHRPKQYDILRTTHLSRLNNIPLFIINGTNDRMCRKDLMETLVSQLSCNTSMHWVKDADHSLNIKGKLMDDVMRTVSQLFIDWCQSVFTVERL